ncbi:MAG: hypothetical protein HY940_06695 [Gammaproteobacteria bacterium]|nr:hypothetical protein [Gammaproteobacteria bacterium]
MIVNISSSRWGWLLAMFVFLQLSACATVKLVGDYDEQIDKGVTQLQKDVEGFLVKLEGTAEKPKDLVEEYKKHPQFYADAKVSISGLRVRADATERNSLTVKMLDGLRANLDRLENFHKEGLKKGEIEGSLRGGFTSQFTAILTFELAKKRGEKTDESKAKAGSTPTPSTEGDKK